MTGEINQLVVPAKLLSLICQRDLDRNFDPNKLYLFEEKLDDKLPQYAGMQRLVFRGLLFRSLDHQRVSLRIACCGSHTTRHTDLRLVKQVFVIFVIFVFE